MIGNHVIHNKFSFANRGNPILSCKGGFQFCFAVLATTYNWLIIFRAACLAALDHFVVGVSARSSLCAIDYDLVKETDHL